MRVRVLPSAKRDLARGIRFYEMQEAGLGAYFLDSVSSDIDSLQLRAGIHPVRREHHRFLAERFPANPNPEGLVWIPPGTFTMGSPPTEAEREDLLAEYGVDETQHEVTLVQRQFLRPGRSRQVIRDRPRES